MAINLVRKAAGPTSGGGEFTSDTTQPVSYSGQTLQLYSPTDYQIIDLKSEGSVGNAFVGLIRGMSETSGVELAGMLIRTDGADNSGMIQFRINSAGTLATKGAIGNDGSWILGEANTQTAIHQFWGDNFSFNADTPQSFFYLTKTNGTGGAYDPASVTASGDNGISFFQNTSGSNYAYLALQARPTIGGTSASAGIAVDVTAAGQSNLVFFTRNGGNNAEVGRVSNGAGWTLGDPVGGGVHNVYGGFMRVTRLDTSTNAAFQVIKALNSAANTNTIIDFGINGTASNSGRIVANGANTALLTTTSDSRLKKDIVELEGSLAKIAALRPVTYKWKHNDEEAIGFIAQEVLPIIPEAVIAPLDESQFTEETPDYAKYYGFSREQFIPYLVGAIKELKEEFDAYKAAHP